VETKAGRGYQRDAPRARRSPTTGESYWEGTNQLYRPLQCCAGFEITNPALRLAAERLTAHVTKDHDLPHEQDPIQDARSIVAFVQDAIANC
jgi:hypothetical protein